MADLFILEFIHATLPISKYAVFTQVKKMVSYVYHVKDMQNSVTYQNNSAPMFVYSVLYSYLPGTTTIIYISAI